jgi:hypothetical protein
MEPAPVVICAALEYLLDVRRQELIELIDKVAQRGNYPKMHEIRLEIDRISRILQEIHSDNKTITSEGQIDSKQIRTQKATSGKKSVTYIEEE